MSHQKHAGTPVHPLNGLFRKPLGHLKRSGLLTGSVLWNSLAEDGKSCGAHVTSRWSWLTAHIHLIKGGEGASAFRSEVSICTRPVCWINGSCKETFKGLLIHLQETPCSGTRRNP